MTQLSFAFKKSAFLHRVQQSQSTHLHRACAWEGAAQTFDIFTLEAIPYSNASLTFSSVTEGLAVAKEIADITQVQRVYALLPCCPSKLSDFYPEQKLEKFADPTTVALRQPFPSKVVCPTSCVCSVCCVWVLQGKPCRAKLPFQQLYSKFWGFVCFYFSFFKGYLVDLRTLIVYSTWGFFFCFLWNQDYSK